MSTESRAIEFLRTAVNERTYEMANIINVWEEYGRCEFIASINGTSHYYYLIETLNPATEVTSEYYTYEVILQKNKGSQGIPPEDSRVLDAIYMLTESCPKDNSQEYKEEKTRKIITMWKEAIMNNLFVVPTDVKDGIDLVDIPDNQLSSEQLTKKYTVLNWIYKINARNRIEAEVGDTLDLIADLSKRVSLNERLLLRLSNEILNNNAIPDPIRSGYAQLCAEYVYAVDNNIFMDRTDLENPLDIFTTLMSRMGQITSIVKEEYFDNKK